MSSADNTIRPAPPFENKRALIYGAARGIGRAVALEFARRGAQVAIADIDIDGAEETAADIVRLGSKAVSLKCDVMSDESVRTAAIKAERGIGEIDIVMNNVDVLLSGNPEDNTIAEWQHIVDINLFSVVRSNAIFLPKMMARGSGHIINTASFAGLYLCAVNRLPYAASKAAVVALSESLALYLLPRGVRVSCFCPGPLLTGVAAGMQQWSANIATHSPGAQFKVITAGNAAVILADGMRDGRIIIPTDEKIWEVMRRHAASPDQFIHDWIEHVAHRDHSLSKI